MTVAHDCYSKLLSCLGNLKAIASNPDPAHLCCSGHLPFRSLSQDDVSIIPISIQVPHVEGSYPYLEGIFSAEAFLAVTTRERLYCQVYPFVSFEVMVSIKTLRALIALVRPFCLLLLLMVVVRHHCVRMTGQHTSRSHDLATHSRKRGIGCFIVGLKWDEWGVMRCLE